MIIPTFNQPREPLGRPKGSGRAFTLIELLVTVSILAVLLSVLLPSLSSAREQARAAVCGSNIRQLVTANTMYANENRGRACPGARESLENLHRWHGSRDDPSAPFDPSQGPLVPYIGPEGEMKQCPSFRGFTQNTNQAFELGNGGYGYNNAFVGTVLKHITGGFYIVETDESGVQVDRIAAPAETLAFADSGFSASDLIEYSFAEPRYMPTTGYRADPSIHFRHSRSANVAWCDGHVDRRTLSFTWSSGLYTADPGRHGIGWFGQSDDNRYFDLQ